MFGARDRLDVRHPPDFRQGWPVGCGGPVRLRARHGHLPPMRHAVLGMGGVGGLIAATLAHAGEDVTAVVRAEALPGYPSEVSIEGPRGVVSGRVLPVAS